MFLFKGTRSEFSKNVLVLMTGTTFAQALPIAISPILTRLYTPDDFGVLALFVGLVSIFTSIVTARYELAIILPQSETDAVNILALSMVIATFSSLVLFLAIVPFCHELAVWLGNDAIAPWLYFVPLAVFLVGLFNALKYYGNRQKQYGHISGAFMLKSVVLVAVQIAVSFIKQGAAGLVSGQIVSTFFANIRLLSVLVRRDGFLDGVTRTRMVKMAKRFANFPKFSMWAGLLNSLSTHMSNILISVVFNTVTLGFYSLVQRLLGMPSALIGDVLGQVYYRQAIAEKQTRGVITETFNVVVLKLLWIGIPIFSLLFAVSEELFSFVFGEAWQVAGSYAQIVIPLFFFRFLAASLSNTIHIFEKQRFNLIINGVMIISNLGWFGAAEWSGVDFTVYLYGYSVLNSLFYLYILWYYFRLKGQPCSSK